jgi:hypothetical protein
MLAPGGGSTTETIIAMITMAAMHPPIVQRLPDVRLRRCRTVHVAAVGVTKE